MFVFTVQKQLQLQLQLSRWVTYSALAILGLGDELYRARHSHAGTVTIVKEDLRSPLTD